MPWNPDAHYVREAMYAVEQKKAIGYGKLIAVMRTAIEKGKSFRCYWIEHVGFHVFVE